MTEKYILAHTQHPVDLGNTKPVQNVRHQGLETHVFHTSDVFGPLEIVRSAILSSLSGVIHDYNVN